MIWPCYQFNTNSLTFGRPSEHWWDSWFCPTQAQVRDSSRTGLGFNSWRWTSHLSPHICQLWASVHNIKDRRSERMKPTTWSHCSYKTEQTRSKSPTFTPKHLLTPPQIRRASAPWFPSEWKCLVPTAAQTPRNFSFAFSWCHWRSKNWY